MHLAPPLANFCIFSMDGVLFLAAFQCMWWFNWVSHGGGRKPYVCHLKFCVHNSVVLDVSCLVVCLFFSYFEAGSRSVMQAAVQ